MQPVHDFPFPATMPGGLSCHVVQDAVSARRNQARTRHCGLRRASLLTALFLTGLHPLHGAQAATKTVDAGIPVSVATIRTGDMPVVLSELGTVIPVTNVTVQNRVEGYLTQVLFTEGQEVHEGDLLAVIDPRPYEAELKQYSGQLAADQAQLDEARMDNVRYQKLLKRDSIDTQTAQDQQYKVKQLEGTVEADQGLVDTYRLDVEYCHITAPVSGRVGIRAVDRGNYVTAAQSGGLAVLTQMQPISVIFTLPQDKLGMVWKRLRTAKTLPVEAWDSTDTTKLTDGTVSSLDSQIDTSTGTVRLRALFPNRDEDLFPNQFVNAHLLVDTEHDVLLAPTSAIQSGPNGSFVYVVQPDSTVAVRLVKTGVSQGDTVVVTSGLKADEQVVTSGIDRLHAGAKVTIPVTTTQGG
ncbi:MdtA/MuxA family multidrug efflux RND transporter periplasmic adaptor subunit [Gluconacetobacter entanii]|uniref:MdtA/MuxA family multidrug efflux RND transporter periplasmic adaptor subunit n=1 Tax=Gluconacetobacter entanii TaxID=108528 RepID=A0ABT3K296_9PROT|nr:MdtA/MuxA family multidrug efflux RND transporter periplasmic adaptor subunit [Gluconacetobacter entanii]MCW4589531.1 MdtA/MuxA family multidrug efflux RND transporter periplasmic adaptor subunit [Gluconacetobacter entanii]MCW4593372.1 MdtA/MuxA family multidrug efflux RND transporter periplasmic adaptor subunit [Gluconacetobacter entanii]